MSKLQLKKELNNMTKDQLEELILELYSSRKDIKNFLEYYVNPNVEALLDRYYKAVNKELSRSKRGYSKARVSKIKAAFHDMESYLPGTDVVLEAMLATIRMMIACERMYDFSETLVNGTVWFMNQYLKLANKELMLDTSLAKLVQMLDDESLGHRYFRRRLRDEIAVAVREMGQNISHR